MLKESEVKLDELNCLYILLDRANHDEYLSRIGIEEATKFLNENQKYAIILRQVLQRLEAIDQSNPSEALEKLEMLSDCAEAMKEAPSSNWIEYANNETELDYQLWIAYEDLKQYILKSQEQEKVLEIIKEKGVNVGYLKTCKTLDDYNSDCWNDEEDFNKSLTQEEFDLLKRWIECQKN